MQQNRRQSRLPLALSILAFGLAGLVPAQAVQTPPTCYHCTLVNQSYYDCSGGFAAGGTGCSVSGDSCTVSGICGSSAEPGVPVSVPAQLVREVAQVHPRLAASLWRIGSAGAADSVSEIHWLAGPMTARDVDALLAGGKLARSAESGEVVYKVSVVRSMDGATATLVISPASQAAEADFSYFEVHLKRNGVPEASNSSTLVYTVEGWSIY